MGEGDSPDVPNADERIPDWVVLSVKSGWTPKEVFLWIFPYFGDMLFDLIKEDVGLN